uniref:Selenoprotein F n=1 Tax=Tetraselmis chuii TaxID=63592 RepID=A0A7S1WZG1_9CHLO|mmetsp:Transcript_12786/g.22843  ORF Transcript_12786/g.22843 Transcript_12786/m.22843 type:complete len:173 (+) Transcript_12786:150-668(+)|eukprot:CAMPEP_0177750922 /NCGR_PEP_ID=MMETSP0491_2-20121128/97_1 /TAXON_ID=63592 /ORGANISM="Tetraselmis chuii, Strain PLY429" /LENGTH=172 /DNA_ID=CAMNT_0019265997 /DNA_START=160 /DNA_END=678 /DNA_ORIENTATION=-
MKLPTLLSLLGTLFLLLFHSVQVVAKDDDKSTTQDCEKLGFSTLVLCSDCQLLGQYVSDDSLVAECMGCCAEETQSNKKYEKAVLEICKHRLPAYPHINDFISRQVKEYTNKVEVKFKYGAYPRIILKNSAGKTGESVRIDSWQPEHLVEYLADKLIAGEGSVASDDEKDIL